MELQQLKYFKTVAQVGKISAAAEQLFISAPALSTSISRLEKELGMPLFTRTNNRIRLNAQGKIFLKHVNQVFFSLETAKEELRESLQTQEAHIHLLSTSTVIWTDMLAFFMAEHPHITLSLSTVKPNTLLESGLPAKYDFLLAADSDLPPEYGNELNSVYLMDNYPMVMVNAAHRLAKERTVTVDMLKEENIFMPAPQYPLYERIATLFRQRGLSVPAHHSQSFYVRRQMVAMNSGVSFVSMHGKDFAAHPHIACIPLADAGEPWAYHLYWKKHRSLSESEALFRDFATHFFQDLHKV